MKELESNVIPSDIQADNSDIFYNLEEEYPSIPEEKIYFSQAAGNLSHRMTVMSCQNTSLPEGDVSG